MACMFQVTATSIKRESNDPGVAAFDTEMEVAPSRYEASFIKEDDDNESGLLYNMVPPAIATASLKRGRDEVGGCCASQCHEDNVNLNDRQ